MTSEDSTFSWLWSNTESSSLGEARMDRVQGCDPCRRFARQAGASDERRGRKGELLEDRRT